MGAHTTTCSACGAEHRWSKNDAFFEEALSGLAGLSPPSSEGELFASGGFDANGAGDDLFGDNPWRL